MSTLDYQAISALAAVIEKQSFQLAADFLFITQSAVSQRIKHLEQFYGEPVLIRTLPYRPTDLGLTLLSHYKRVTLLEESVLASLSKTASSPTLSIAINRDSLETWFVKVMEQLGHLMPLTVNIIADDQERTLQYLKNGVVSACISTSMKSIPGCKSTFLGYFNYAMVASPEFIKKFFPDKVISKNQLIESPVLKYDRHDNLHNNYLKYYFGIDNIKLKRCQYIPSQRIFKLSVLQGYAYGLIPIIDIASELASNMLVNLFPDRMWQLPLYWHSFEVETDIYRRFNDLVINNSKQQLQQINLSEFDTVISKTNFQLKSFIG